ncbi:MAG: CBS domain-containing protein [Polyangiaceae bacterium]|nr:CBS domain-containing protein [Polyangiaceae bacterium]
MKVLNLANQCPAMIPMDASVGAARREAERLGSHYLMVKDDDELAGILCQCDLRDPPDDTCVAAILHSPFVFVTTEASGSDAAAVMLECGVGCLPVLSPDGRLFGIITRRQLRSAGCLPDDRGIDRCASCLATHDLHRASSQAEVVFCGDCLERARSHEGLEHPMTLGGSD